MADFPTTLKIDLTSRVLPRDGRVIDTDGDGIAHVRKLHADKFDFEVVLSRMSAADRTSLLNHYTGNAGSTFNFLWPFDGITYVVKYGGVPAPENFKKAAAYTYRVKLLAGA